MKLIYALPKNMVLIKLMSPYVRVILSITESNSDSESVLYTGTSSLAKCGFLGQPSQLLTFSTTCNYRAIDYIFL